MFGKQKFLIGMVHLGPLLGYGSSVSLDEIVANALYDAKILQEAGYDAVLVENNYDLPHKEFVDPGTIVSMSKVIAELKRVVTIPMGACVLWNDYKTALSLAKAYDLQFIRIAVFVDNVRTDFGDIYACDEVLTSYKQVLNLTKEVKVFTDIQVKHSELLNIRPISQSAQEAIQKGSNALIVTGKWTGDAPTLDKLKQVRASVGDFPIIVGSGAEESNLNELLNYADGVIIGTSIKIGNSKDKSQERNLKPYTYRLDPVKAQSFQKKMLSAYYKVN